MNIGLLAYSTNTGLGNQTFEFYRNINPFKTLVIDIKEFNGMPTYHERYTGNVKICGLPRNDDVNWLLDGTDIVFVCESPLNYNLFGEANRRGIATIQQYNYEFFDYVRNPNLPKPTLLCAPTSWYLEQVINMDIAPVRQLRVPVNREKVKFRKIEKCKTFLHVVGRITYKDRNGTREFIEATKKLQVNSVVSIQKPTEAKNIDEYNQIKFLCNQANIKVIEDLENYADLYLYGDVLVLPRKYGGLCLPMNEALSAGLPVIMTDISPNTDILPKEWLCAARATETFNFHAPVQIYQPDVQSLVEVMSVFLDDNKMQESNYKANEIAETISWNNIKSKYEKMLTEVYENFNDR